MIDRLCHVRYVLQISCLLYLTTLWWASTTLWDAWFAQRLTLRLWCPPANTRWGQKYTMCLTSWTFGEILSLSSQESVQVVLPFHGGAKEAILLRDTLCTLTGPLVVDHCLQVSTEVHMSDYYIHYDLVFCQFKKCCCCLSKHPDRYVYIAFDLCLAAGGTIHSHSCWHQEQCTDGMCVRYYYASYIFAEKIKGFTIMTNSMLHVWGGVCT